MIWRAAPLPRSNEKEARLIEEFKIGLFNAPEARRLERPVVAIVAGSAPTAHLLGELEKINIKPVHVYGLTYVSVPHALLPRGR